MFNISLAGFNIEIDNRYNFVKRQCEKYLTDATEPDLSIKVSDRELEDERKSSIEAHGTEHLFSDGYLESICIYRSICEALPLRGAFMLHAAIIELDGHGYAFSARPGVGKSTHASLWKTHLGASIVNGDKPIVTFEDGRAIAWGTPWCGKENWEENRSVPLDALCFIERSLVNFVEPLSSEDVASRLMTQLLLPSDPIAMLEIMNLADRLLALTPCYRVGCDISREAVLVCHEGIKRK